MKSSTDYRKTYVDEQENNKTRKGILNPLSNNLPKTGTNDGYYTGKRNRNSHSPNDRKEEEKIG